MEKLASGSIAVWEGGSLWVFDVPLRNGAPSRNAMHAHHAFQLTFALDGAFTLHLEQGSVSGPYVALAPNVPHAFEPHGRVGLLFVEPESRAGRALTQLTGDAPATALNAETVRDAPELIARAFADPVDARAELRAVGMRLCDRIAGHVHTAAPDLRVRRMIQYAGAHLHETPGINEAAALVDLSPSRASHLFVEETGLPFRTYVLWLRLVSAVDAHAGGASLTEAAHEAGFADSAHFSRTFRRMFGLPAAALDLS